MGNNGCGRINGEGCRIGSHVRTAVAVYSDGIITGITGIDIVDGIAAAVGSGNIHTIFSPLVRGICTGYHNSKGGIGACTLY